MQYIGRLSKMGGRLYLGIPKDLQSQAKKLLKKDLRIVVTELWLDNEEADKPPPVKQTRQEIKAKWKKFDSHMKAGAKIVKENMQYSPEEKD